jgi:hypothetical protein
MLQTRFQNVAQRWRNAESNRARLDPWLNANTRKTSTRVLQNEERWSFVKGALQGVFVCREEALSPDKHPANNHRRKW